MVVVLLVGGDGSSAMIISSFWDPTAKAISILDWVCHVRFVPKGMLTEETEEPWIINANIFKGDIWISQ